MKRMFISFLSVVLVWVNGIVLAEQIRTLDRVGILITVPEDWICETQNDGTEIFYDINSEMIMSIYSEKTDDLLFDHGFEMAVPYVESIFQGDDLWSNVGLIAQNGIYGCYAAGYIEDMPSGFVCLEKDNCRIVFALADLTDTRNPNHMQDKLLDLFPWMNDDVDVDLYLTEKIKFSVGGYEYKVPANWRHSENVDNNERYHTFNGGDVYLSVDMNSGEGKSMESALQAMYKFFPQSQIEILNGNVMGLLMDGKSITGMKMIKACIVNYPGYVEITYLHDGSENQREEFDQLLSEFQRIG